MLSVQSVIAKAHVYNLQFAHVRKTLNFVVLMITRQFSDSHVSNWLQFHVYL